MPDLKRRFAYTAIVNDRPGARDPYIIGRAEHDLPGYAPCAEYGAFNSYAAASARADGLNYALGLSPLEAWTIVASTIRRARQREARS